jgi:fibronectin type 3 domain-containing protein
MRFFGSIQLLIIVVFLYFSSFKQQTNLAISNEASYKGHRLGLIQDEPILSSAIPEVKGLRLDNIPKKFDLSPKLPLPYPQGKQASSVGFVLGYLVKSYYENAKAKNPIDLSKISVSSPSNTKHFFSPSFIYNSINKGKDLGGSLLDGLILLTSRGIPTWQDMPYNQDDYKYLSSDSSSNIYSHKIQGFKKIPTSDILTMKAYISKENPLVASLLFFENFNTYSKGSILNATEGKFIGAQAIALVGYDDSKKAFKIWNSWGPDWGEGGYAWISYSLFQKLGASVYWIDDPPALHSPEDLLTSYPHHLTATRGNYSDRVRISWAQVRSAIGYEIYRKRPNESKYILVGLSVDNFFEDTGVQLDISYQYSVSSVFPESSSILSPDATEGYSSKKMNPSSNMEITGLVATQGKFSDKIIIKWDSLAGIKNYHLYKYNTYSKEFRLLTKTTKPEFIDRKAQRNGNLEFYRVSVAGSFATSSLSPTSFGFTSSRGFALPPPDSVYATQGEFSDKINVAWDEVLGAVDYKIYRFTKESNEWEELSQTANQIYDDTNPKSINNYYSVSSSNKLGAWSRGSEPVLGFLSSQNLRSSSGLKPPEEISIFELPEKSTSKQDFLRLSWKPVNDAKEYNIYSKEVGENWKLLHKVKSNYYQFPKPPASKFYLYSISSINELDMEGSKSKSLAFGWHPKVIDLSTVRSFGVDSRLEKFKGPWTSMYWDGKANVTPVQLHIVSLDDMNQAYKIELNNKIIYQGEYLQENKIVDPQGAFKLELSSSGDALFLEVKDKKILKENTTLSFLRE